MAWFKREKKRIDQPTPPDARRVKTEGLWTKCENCRTIVWKKDLDANWRICPKCQHHFRLTATERLELLLDSRWIEHDVALASASVAPTESGDGMRDAISRALEQLPIEQREAFLLKHVEEMSYDEIAGITGISVSALKMRVKRACDTLRDLLEGVYNG
jgi:acetyl-CoA carboxylase beta subunit